VNFNLNQGVISSSLKNYSDVTFLFENLLHFKKVTDCRKIKYRTALLFGLRNTTGTLDNKGSFKNQVKDQKNNHKT
jgi:hypothetical protein